MAYGKESNAAANASVYARLAKVAADGAFTWFAATNSDGVEFGTSLGQVTRSIMIGSATNFVAGDRLALEVYVDDASGVNMATGYTVTLQEHQSFYLSTGDNGYLPIGGEALMVRDGAAPTGISGRFLPITGAPVSPAGRFVGAGPWGQFYRAAASPTLSVYLAASRVYSSAAKLVTVWQRTTMSAVRVSINGEPHQFHSALSQLADIELADLRVAVKGGDAQTVIEEWDCSVFYLPTASVAAPSLPTGTMNDTQRPTCRVVASAILAHWQQSLVPYTGFAWLNGIDVEWRIYKKADAPGADPPNDKDAVWTGFTRSSIAEFDGGISAASATLDAVPDVDLANGEYYLYTRVSRDTPEGPRNYWSGWSKSASWESDISLPDAPSTLTITPDEANQRIAVKAVVPTTAGYTADTALLSVERSDDLGATWHSVRGMTDLSVTAGATEWSLGYDVLAPRGRNNLQYRVRVNMKHTALAKRFTSAWKTVTNVTGLAALSGSVLLCLDDPAANWSDVQIIGQLEQESGRAAVSIAPLDRDGSVVITGTNAGPRGTLKVICAGASQIAKLDALEAAGGAIIWGTPYGDTSMIAITGVSRSTYGAASSPIVEATINYQTLSEL